MTRFKDMYRVSYPVDHDNKHKRYIFYVVMDMGRPNDAALILGIYLERVKGVSVDYDDMGVKSYMSPAPGFEYGVYIESNGAGSPVFTVNELTADDFMRNSDLLRYATGKLKYYGDAFNAGII